MVRHTFFFSFSSLSSIYVNLSIHLQVSVERANEHGVGPLVNLAVAASG